VVGTTGEGKKKAVHSHARPGMGDDVCSVCQRPRVRARGSGVNSGRVDGVRLYGLHGEVAKRRGCRERMR
jgi:hypothetical protein